MSGPPAPVARIVLCNLESLSSAAGINRLFEALDGRIAVVIASRRYGGKYGSFFGQLRRNLRRSGLRFVLYLGLQLVCHYPLLYAVQAWDRLRGRPLRRRTLRQLARRHNALYIAAREPNAPQIVAQLAALKPDLVLAAQFDHVIRAPLIALPAHGVLNVHASLLPRFRGPFPCFWTALKAPDECGVTVHRVEDETLDTGAIVGQRRSAPIPGETVMAMESRLFDDGIALILDVLRAIDAGAARATPQEAAGASYFSYPAGDDVEALHRTGRYLFTLRDFFRLATAK